MKGIVGTINDIRSRRTMFNGDSNDLHVFESKPVIFYEIVT